MLENLSTFAIDSTFPMAMLIWYLMASSKGKPDFCNKIKNSFTPRTLRIENPTYRFDDNERFVFVLIRMASFDVFHQRGVAGVKVGVAERYRKTVVAAVNVQQAGGQTVGLVVAKASVVGVDVSVVVGVVGKRVDIRVESV